MDYEEKVKVYAAVFDPFGLPYENQLELENLLAIIYFSLKAKDKTLRVIDVFQKLILNRDLIVNESFVENTSVRLEVALQGTAGFTPNNYGFTTPKDIVARIIAILNGYVPF